MVLNFCHAIFKTSLISNVIGREQIPNCKQRNRIMRKCKEVQDSCGSIFQKNRYRMGREWLINRMKTCIEPALKKAESENPQLESFALYVLYINFFDCRKQKIDDIFTPIIEQEDELFAILDLIAEARGEESREMYELAIKTIEILKR
jgi:bifunctional pyridoxal-dependent enzyme with beta-cystathionase and maltose regulon repressor activities